MLFGGAEELGGAEAGGGEVSSYSHEHQNHYQETKVPGNLVGVHELQ